jgi:hypothetical protein
LSRVWLTIVKESDSTYFSDLDVSRVHLVCTLFSFGIEDIRGGKSAINRGDSKKPFFGVALGAVSCNFKRELKPYEPYEMWTRVLTWDEKWIYILTHFVKKGAVKPKAFTLYPEQNAKELRKKKSIKDMKEHESVKAMEANPAVVATALSKCVFKAGRRTISPYMMMKTSGVLPVDTIDDALYTSAEYYSRSSSICSDSEAPTRRTSVDIDPLTRLSSASTDSGIVLNSAESVGKYEMTEMEKIEKERQRGMRAAAFLNSNNQSALDLELLVRMKQPLASI